VRLKTFSILFALTITLMTVNQAQANTAVLPASAIVEAEMAARSGGPMKLVRFLGRFAGVVGIAELAAEVYYEHVLEREVGTFALDDVFYDVRDAFSTIFTSDDPMEQEEALQSIEAVYATSASDPDERDRDNGPAAPDGDYGSSKDRDRDYDGPDYVPGDYGGGGARNGGDGVLF
jgi:hypothetical protein